MRELLTGEHDLLAFFKPDTVSGALIYLALFVLAGLVLSRVLRATVHAAMLREGHVDRTGISFVQQLAVVLIWVSLSILYAHLIPMLRALGTALLAGAGVASVVIGLAAQSTLGNLVAGISITIYRPFRLGDTLQVTAPTGAEIGVVQWISLGYTTLRTADDRLIVLPNSVAANQVVLNLSETHTRSQWSVAIRCARSIDPQKLCEWAQKVATEVLGAPAVAGCFLTKVDPTGAVFDLRLQTPDVARRASVRASLLAHLMREFPAAQLSPAGADPPTFG
jgi:small conductance mechanosensitive channel